VFVGAKMMLIDVFKVPTAVSLAVIASVIGGSIALSLLRPPRVEAPPIVPLAPETEKEPAAVA
jgi:tellurite resistance protein TerC